MSDMAENLRFVAQALSKPMTMRRHTLPSESRGRVDEESDF